MKQQTCKIVTISGNTVSEEFDLAGSLNGGGIFSERGTILLNQCVVSGNRANGIGYSDSFGGGISCYHSLNITQCVISGNAADFGGGISALDLLISDSAVGKNSASKFAGGIYVGGTAAIVDCTVYDNTAAVRGGGLYLYFGKSTIEQSTISDNQAPLGAGIFVEPFGGFGTPLMPVSATASHCTIVDNGNSL